MQTFRLAKISRSQIGAQQQHLDWSPASRISGDVTGSSQSDLRTTRNEAAAVSDKES